MKEQNMLTSAETERKNCSVFLFFFLSSETSTVVVFLFTKDLLTLYDTGIVHKGEKIPLLINKYGQRQKHRKHNIIFHHIEKSHEIPNRERLTDKVRWDY